MKHGSIFFALNAEGGKAPPRVQLLPSGTKVIGRDGRWWNNPDPQAVVTRTLARNVDLSIDENHMADMGVGKPAPALCWLSNPTVEPNGEVWADARWTPLGRSLVEAEAYRYISPAFTWDNQTKEITAIVGAGLTNRPNFDLAELNGESQEQEEETMKKIAQALGLPEDSTEDQILVALNAMKTALNTQNQRVDLAAYAPRADLAAMEQRALNAETRLADQAKSDLTKRAETAVNTAVEGGKIAPASKAEYLALCATEEGLKTFNSIMEKTVAAPTAPKTPEGDPPKGSLALNAEELQVAEAMGITPEQFLKNKEAK